MTGERKKISRKRKTKGRRHVNTPLPGVNTDNITHTAQKMCSECADNQLQSAVLS
ncbi:hypothetical protein KIN20_010856 [Parelaphostrongylus tenuis]|uniref:Uncharacterized protein n=1 Tax=Parelaphostrongylus tenuis TaxID=148309 RepID=A0AAD5MSN5_PARTN|nr:hypothetical protein KIN20_010856 [Parelaphostrongylus tenuis]